MYISRQHYLIYWPAPVRMNFLKAITSVFPASSKVGIKNITQNHTFMSRAHHHGTHEVHKQRREPVIVMTDLCSGPVKNYKISVLGWAETSSQAFQGGTEYTIQSHRVGSTSSWVLSTSRPPFWLQTRLTKPNSKASDRNKGKGQKGEKEEEKVV